MKKHLFFPVALLLLSITGYSQVGIGTASPDNSAMLDVSSTTKGFLAPRLTTAQRITLAATAVDGLMVYDTDLHTYFFYKGGSFNTWDQHLSSSTGWGTTGTGGTDSTVNFIGTTDAQALILKTNNMERIRINKVGYVGLGIPTPHEQLEITGNLRIPVTSATAGIIYVGPDRFIHSKGTKSMFTGIQAGNLTTTGSYNTGNGYQALNSITTASRSCAFGYQALYTNTNFSGNCAFGNQALYSNGNAGGNNAFGDQALYSNTNGPCNVAIGTQALFTNDNGSNNTAVGYWTLNKNVGGSNNNATGYQSLYKNTAGSDNNSYGSAALYNNTTGSHNNAFGFQSLNSNTTGTYNNAFGDESLMHNSTGSNNISMGYDALLFNTTGFSNTAIGATAGHGNDNGSRNIYFGDSAGYYNVSGNKNIFIGYQAGLNETGSDRLYIANSGTSSPLIWGDFANSVLGLNGKVGIGTSAPNSTIQVAGSFATTLANKSSDYTLTVQDHIITCSAGLTITLPTAAGITGREYSVKRTYSGGADVTIGTTAGQTIDGSTTYALGAQWKYATFVSDGSNWLIIGSN